MFLQVSFQVSFWIFKIAHMRSRCE